MVLRRAPSIAENSKVSQITFDNYKGIFNGDIFTGRSAVERGLVKRESAHPGAEGQ